MPTMSDDPHDPKADQDRTDAVRTPEEPKNPWAYLDSPPEGPEPERDVLHLKDVSSSWLAGYILKKGCFFSLVIVAFLIGSCSILMMVEDHVYKIKLREIACVSQLSEIRSCLYCLTQPDEMLLNPESLRKEAEALEIEITPDTTIPDLVRDGLRLGMLNGNLNGKYLRCARSGEPYLVFPVPASVLRTEDDPQNRIPIVIDPPVPPKESKLLLTVCRLFYSWIWKEYVNRVRVLYSDSTIGSISREEAEKLISEQSPVPIIPVEIQPDSMSGGD